jgi:hypothetical protein
MGRLTRFGGLILFACVLGSCTKPSRPLSVRFAASAPLRSPTLAQMNCFFVSLSADTFPASTLGVPACMGLGRVSALQTFDQISTGGATLKAPIATRLRIRVLGVVTTEACDSVGQIDRLFTTNSRPGVYEVGATSTTLSEAGTVTVTSAYSPTTATDLATCDSSTVNVEVTSIDPAMGLHRGGLEVTIQGTGFDSNTTAKIAGAACTNPVVTGTTRLTCTTPSLTAQVADVTVENPGRSSDTLVGGFKAFQMVYALVSNSGYYLRAYRQDPATGTLDAVTQVAAEGTALLWVVVHPSGKWVLTSQSSANAVIPWQVNLATGELTKGAAIAVPDGPKHLAFSSDGILLFVNQLAVKSAASCTFNVTAGTCGTLASAQWGASPEEPKDLSVSPDGNFLLARAGSSNALHLMPIGAGGSLATATTSTNFSDSDLFFFHPAKSVFFIHNATGAELQQASLAGNGSITTGAPFGEASSLGLASSYGISGSGLSLYLFNPGALKVRRWDLNAGTGFGANATVPTDADHEFLLNGSFSAGASQMAIDDSGEHLFLLRNTTSGMIQAFTNSQAERLPQSNNSFQSADFSREGPYRAVTPFQLVVN